MKSTEFVWIQRDGTPIRIREMSDEHLLNTIRMLRRWGKRMAEMLNSDNHPWDADDAQGMYWFEGHEITEQHPSWRGLDFERRVRALEELTS